MEGIKNRAVARFLNHLVFIGSYISLFSSDSVFTKSRVYLIVPLVHYLNSQQTNEIWQ